MVIKGQHVFLGILDLSSILTVAVTGTYTGDKTVQNLTHMTHTHTHMQVQMKLGKSE